MKCYCASLIIFNIVLAILGKVVGTLGGGGRLFYPPGRSSLWRFNYTNVPINEKDNTLNCGGFKTHWILNEGKCGVCGDAWKRPRDHEFGGKYYSGIISESYTQNTIINVSVEILENLNGWFEFKLCRHDSTNNCVDNYTLQIGDTGRTRYRVRQNGFHVVPLQLPGSFECKQCLLQWKYHAGTRWGCDKNKCCKGCGPKQEEFYSCADVAIKRSTTQKVASKTISSRFKPCDISVYQRWWCRTQCIGHECYSGFCACLQGSKSRTKRSAAIQCQSIGVWTSAGMTNWCNNNCKNEIPYCPASICTCTEVGGETTTTTVTTTTTRTSTVTSTPTSTTTTTTTSIPSSTATTTTATTMSPGTTQPYPVNAPGIVKVMVTAACKYCSDKNNITCRNLYCPGYDVDSTGISDDVDSTGISGSNLDQKIIRLTEHFCETCDAHDTQCRKLFCQNSDGLPVMKDLGIAIKCSMCGDLGDQTCLQDPSCSSNLNANTEAPTTSESTVAPVGVVCTPKDEYRQISGIEKWCNDNRDESACNCIGTMALNGQVAYEPGYICRGAGAYATNANMGNWCLLNCALNNCPSTHCYCYPPTTIKQTTTTTTAATTTSTSTGTDSYSLNLLNGMICDMSQSDQNTFRSTIFRYCPVYNRDFQDASYNTDRVITFTTDLLHQFTTSQKPDLSSYTIGGLQSHLASKINQGFCGGCTGLGIQICTQYCDS